VKLLEQFSSLSSAMWIVPSRYNTTLYPTEASRVVSQPIQERWPTTGTDPKLGTRWQWHHMVYWVASLAVSSLVDFNIWKYSVTKQVAKLVYKFFFVEYSFKFILYPSHTFSQRA
jgi:hypothetical protein